MTHHVRRQNEKRDRVRAAIAGGCVGIWLAITGAHSIMAQPVTDRAAIVINGRARPSRPTTPPPRSCGSLRVGATRYAHWEVQSTQLAHQDTVAGKLLRIVDARATFLPRRDLDRVSLAAYVGNGQALGEFTLSEQHNGLPPGAYCLVATYDPRVPAPLGEYDPRRWQTYLYAASDPKGRPVAWVPFVSRRDPKRDAVDHPHQRPRPYPLARFEFLDDSELARGTARDAVAPASPDSLTPPNLDFGPFRGGGLMT